MRLPIALFGLLLLASTFSYEDFERRLQNYLEDAWIKLDDRNRAASGRHARAVGGFAAGTLRLLDRLFGPMTVSWLHFGRPTRYGLAGARPHGAF